jgi:hypothetical protein
MIGIYLYLLLLRHHFSKKKSTSIERYFFLAFAICTSARTSSVMANEDAVLHEHGRHNAQRFYVWAPPRCYLPSVPRADATL